MPVNPLFQRLSLLTGVEALDALGRARVAVFGAGGVGGWCAEALVRSGIGGVGIVDSDRVCITNINRQIQATCRTVGQPKAAVLRERLLEINPRCIVQAHEGVFSRERAQEFDWGSMDYCVDAIDSLTCKLDLIEQAAAEGIPLFSSMGMAQKLDPAQLKTADIWETQGCPLARLVRQGLRKRGWQGHFTAVYSAERLPLHREIAAACGSPRCLCTGRNGGHSGDGREDSAPDWCASKRVINGSAVTVTAVAGMILASLVIRDICSRQGAP
jgi:tRNA A37 threonylcarbamoyladenosine dehydratase